MGKTNLFNKSKKKDQAVVVGRRGGKTNKAIESIRTYISNISKRERQQIEKELEQDEESKPVSFTTVRNYGAGEWITLPIEWLNEYKPTAAIEQDVQDVSFE